MQDTLHPKEPHGARATQLAPSAVTASAVGGSANHAANSPRWPSLSDDERLVQRRAVTGSSTSRSSSERLGQPHFCSQT
jgi:hypothetical protein